MMKAMKKNYISPEMDITVLDVEGFICASIKTVRASVFVDEFESFGYDPTDSDSYQDHNLEL